MRADKELAIKLRLQGKSYLQISKIIKAPKSTLSSWLGNIVLSDEIRTKINSRGRKKSIDALLRRNKLQTNLAIARSLQIQNEAKKDLGLLSKQNLFYLGVALYWAEGYKRLKVINGRERTSHPVSMTNSDPYLVRAFVVFLLETCEVPLERIKASLRLFKHINENEAIRFWSKNTGVPVANFRKTYYGISRSSLGKKPFNRLPYGIIQISVADTKLFHRIIGWIAGLKEGFKN